MCCRFCKITYSIGDHEQCTCETIVTIRDGSRRLSLDLFRSIVEGDDENEIEPSRESKLVLSNDVELGDHFESIQQFEIDIRYCPFCGEEL